MTESKLVELLLKYEDTIFNFVHNYNFSNIERTDHLYETTLGYLEWRFSAFDNEESQWAKVSVKYFYETKTLKISKSYIANVSKSEECPRYEEKYGAIDWLYGVYL